MFTYANKAQENENRSAMNTVAQKQSRGKPATEFIDNRPVAIAQRKLQEAANNRPRTIQLQSVQGMAMAAYGLPAVIQRFGRGTAEEVIAGEAFENDLQSYSELNSLIRFRLEIQAESYAGTPEEAEIHTELFTAKEQLMALKRRIVAAWPGIKKELLDPYYQPLVEQILRDNEVETKEAEEIEHQDPELTKLLDYFSASWRIPKDNPVFRDRVKLLQIIIISPYPNGNCHGYSIRQADQFMDVFSIEEWRQQMPHIIVYTKGTKIYHSARISGGGRLTQTFSNGMPLFSCNQAAFTAYAGYDGNYTLPAQVNELKAATTNYLDRTPQEIAFGRLLDEVDTVTHYWQYDDDSTKRAIYQEVDQMTYSEANVIRLQAIKEQYNI